MTLIRTRAAWCAALGLMVSAMAVSAVADDKHEKHGDGHGDHDHAAMQAEKNISDALKSMPPGDLKQALAQRFCPIMERSRLGAMGTPIKVMVEGKPLFVCCKGCSAKAQTHGKHTLAKVRKLTRASAALAKLPAKDRVAAECQKYCAIAEKNLLGSMGAPIELTLNGKPVLLCCKGCVAKANAAPDATLAKVAALHREHEHAEHMREDHKHGQHRE